MNFAENITNFAKITFIAVRNGNKRFLLLLYISYYTVCENEMYFAKKDDFLILRIRKIFCEKKRYAANSPK